MKLSDDEIQKICGSIDNLSIEITRLMIKEVERVLIQNKIKFDSPEKEHITQNIFFGIVLRLSYIILGGNQQSIENFTKQLKKRFIHIANEMNKINMH